jgi:hypothetical protein
MVASIATRKYQAALSGVEEINAAADCPVEG